MNVEIVWLAYDNAAVERAWREISIRQLYMEILEDSFRKKVDPRSMLFHKGQFYLLSDLELLMKRGGSDLTLEEYLARLFHKGVEEFPTDSGELFFDYRLICYFTSWRMADEYHLVEPFMRNLGVDAGWVDAKAPWSLIDYQSVNTLFSNLGETSMQQVLAVANKHAGESMTAEDYAKLVTNYIEFNNYAFNNHLEVFYYNNQTDIRRWGNLVERKAARDRRVIELTYSPANKQSSTKSADDQQSLVDTDLVSKMRFKRRIENLEQGLKDIDPLIRQKAAEGLGVYGNFQSVQALIEAIHDEDSEVRQEVVRALGTIGDPRSVDAIIQLVLKDDSVSVIMSGAQALVNIGDVKGLETLIELLLRGVYDVAVQIANFPDLVRNKTAVNMLLQAMQHPNEVVRRQVAFILGDIPNKGSVDTLVTSLHDDDIEVQANSASSLGRIGSKRALPELYACRNNVEPLQYRWVIEEAIDSILEKGRLVSP